MSDRCGAKTRSGSPCRKPKVPGRPRCRLHGGLSLAAGPTHPRWKHGRYSVVGVPENLAAQVQRAAEDPDLLSLREEIALVQATIVDLITRPGVSPSEYLRGVRRLAAQVRSEGGTKASTVLDLVSLIEQAGQAVDLYDEIAELAVKKSRLVDSESKRLEQLGQQISAERAYLMIRETLLALREEVKDGHVLARVGSRLASILGRSTGRGVDSVLDVSAQPTEQS